jgi:two-component system, NarL family, response regulator DevR
MNGAPLDRSRPLRVVVVDADERTRESLAGLLAIGRKCIVVGSASHVLQALALVGELVPDVIVVDPRLPEIDGGRAFIAQARALSPQVRVLVMGWSGDIEHDLPAGSADGYVRKTFRPRELLDAVLAAAQQPQN